MRLTRVYIDQAIAPGARLELDKQSAHYLQNVLRLKSGDELVIFNGDGFEFRAQLIEATRKKAGLSVLERSAKQPFPPLNIHLGIGLSKGDRLDWAIQKATELGVTSVTPLITGFSTLKLARDRLEKKYPHWQGIIRSACEQSGRCHLPELHHVIPLTDWLARQDKGLKLVLDPHRGENMHSQTAQKDLVLLIGPEGGLSEAEIKTAHGNGFVSIQLGTLVMRTETAPVAAIAAAQTLWGSFRNVP